MSIKINNQDIVAINKGNQVITEVYKGTDLVWQLVELGMDDDIFFVDPEVGRVLYVNGLIADPIKSSKRELSRITSLRTKIHEMHSYFYNNEIITKFPELKYLTGLTSLAGTFSQCINLIEVGNIPKRVTDMYGTFIHCISLTTVGAIPNSVTNMRETFIGCRSLINAPIIPSSITSMFGTFEGCKSLIKAPIIPEGVTNMDRTFYSCSNLIEAPVIPEGVIGMNETFRVCESLIEAPIIPEGVIGMNTTFAGCKSLIEAPAIPEGVTDMSGAFSGCTNLIKAPRLPISVVFLENTFEDCTSLTEAPIIPNGDKVIEVMTYIFKGCTGLTGRFISEAVIPPRINNNSSSFSDTQISRIYVPDESVSRYKNARSWDNDRDMIYPMSEMDGYDSFFEDPEVGRVLKTRGVIANANQSSIEELATITRLNSSSSSSSSYFFSNTVLTKFPELKYCTGLSSLRYAFFGCSNLTEVGNIPEGVTNMYGTFMFCSSLIEAPAIPEGVTDMGGTFRGCTKLDGIFIIKPATPPINDITFENANVVAIYVPDTSVNTYKTASGWSDFADKIKPMSEMPE